MTIQKQARPGFREVKIQRTKHSQPESLGYMKDVVESETKIVVPMMQTSIQEIRAIAAVGHYPHKVIATRWDESERVFEEPTVVWNIGTSDGYPCIYATVSEGVDRVADVGDSFGCCLANITQPKFIQSKTERVDSILGKP